jgi:hypothetical protein
LVGVRRFSIVHLTVPESIEFMPGEVGEGCADFAFSACAQYSNLQAERACGSLRIACLGQGQRVFQLRGKLDRMLEELRTPTAIAIQAIFQGSIEGWMVASLLASLKLDQQSLRFVRQTASRGRLLQDHGRE